METLRVACFHVRVASRREVVRHGSTPLTSRSVTIVDIALPHFQSDRLLWKSKCDGYL
ncbi:hypothetical protein [Nostoc sp.]|uniref:hypothetical protein n=1 Tax=Nostoc sp. TaxID=1180 RepID=UPI002FFCE874